MKKLFALMIFLFPCFAFSQYIIPQPASMAVDEGHFILKDGTGVAYNSKTLLPMYTYLQNALTKDAGKKITNKKGKAHITLRLVKGNPAAGSYSLTVNPKGIDIAASGREGVFNGIQSLLQLVEQSDTIPSFTINDAPRYQWRGFMLDESRHFFGKAKVKMLLDWMARYKLNHFHWHLTDSHGWRLQIKKYPKLTSVGGKGNFTDSIAEAKYYTQTDIKEIVAYAKARFITVVPEIDMPGHATAANRAYPQFSGGSDGKDYANFTFDPSQEKTYAYLGNILRETNSLFPAKMIHLGGDEVFLGIQAWWKKPLVLSLMKKKGYKNPTELEHYFFRRMGDTVTKLGDKVLCWDEAVEADLPPARTIVFWWRQNKPQNLQMALDKKYQVVLCPRLPMYLDFVQDTSHVSGRRWDDSEVDGYHLLSNINRVENVYNFPDAFMNEEHLKSTAILGVQANIWTETVGSHKRLDFMLFPRMAALAEAGWTTKANKNTDAFGKKMIGELKRYDKAGIYYYDAFNPKAHPEPIDFAPKEKVKD
ncbi:MAG: beta-N-acetylhexosaminidase [Mucilaginibacter sp.]|nr:beta-N-acetylhexosaminidase [Mucilaginibacter sp.]